jgi:hypothetical protein
MISNKKGPQVCTARPKSRDVPTWKKQQERPI